MGRQTLPEGEVETRRWARPGEGSCLLDRSKKGGGTRSAVDDGTLTRTALSRRLDLSLWERWGASPIMHRERLGDAGGAVGAFALDSGLQGGAHAAARERRRGEKADA